PERLRPADPDAPVRRSDSRALLSSLQKGQGSRRRDGPARRTLRSARGVRRHRRSFLRAAGVPIAPGLFERERRDAGGLLYAADCQDRGPDAGDRPLWCSVLAWTLRWASTQTKR